MQCGMTPLTCRCCACWIWPLGDRSKRQVPAVLSLGMWCGDRNQQQPTCGRQLATSGVSGFRGCLQPVSAEYLPRHTEDCKTRFQNKLRCDVQGVAGFNSAVGAGCWTPPGWDGVSTLWPLNLRSGCKAPASGPDPSSAAAASAAAEGLLLGGGAAPAPPAPDSSSYERRTLLSAPGGGVLVGVRPGMQGPIRCSWQTGSHLLQQQHATPHDNLKVDVHGTQRSEADAECAK